MLPIVDNKSKHNVVSETNLNKGRNMPKINPIVIAIESLNCTQSDLARQIGVKRATVSIWKKRGFIPVRNVKKVAEVTGIPAYVLCPEYFPAQLVRGE